MSASFNLPSVNIGPIDENPHGVLMDTSSLPHNYSYNYGNVSAIWSTASINSDAINTDEFHVQLFEYVGTGSVMVFEVMSPTNSDTFQMDGTAATTMSWSGSMITPYSGGPLAFVIQTVYGPDFLQATYLLNNLVISLTGNYVKPYSMISGITNDINRGPVYTNVWGSVVSPASQSFDYKDVIEFTLTPGYNMAFNGWFVFAAEGYPERKMRQPMYWMGGSPWVDHIQLVMAYTSSVYVVAEKT